jgi:hypothetical protein
MEEATITGRCNVCAVAASSVIAVAEATSQTPTDLLPSIPASLV